MLYFNENEPFVAQWLRNLYPDSTVDERSIVDVAEMGPSTRRHFFAGIAGWELALRMAGWPDDLEVWTGSCPCQPFSNAGKRKGKDDSRHLWPEFLRLIDEQRPATIFGEQVASRLGREWLSGVRADLEALGYAVGAADLCAAGAGAPHIRQRLYWVAHDQGSGQLRKIKSEDHPARHERTIANDPLKNGEGLGPSSDRLADAPRQRPFREHSLLLRQEPGWHEQDSVETSGRSQVDQPLVNPNDERSQGRRLRLRESRGELSAWSSGVAVQCADGKARRVEPGIQPLAHGVPSRVGRLRAYGNAIVPQIAAIFVRAFMDSVGIKPCRS